MTGRIITFIDKETDKGVRFPEKVPGIRPFLHFPPRYCIHDKEDDFPKTRFYRLWDLAHTEKQTQKADPDWTSGTLLAYTKIDGLWHLWIKHVARVRAKANERDVFIHSATDRDGQGVAVAVENSLDSKDAVVTLQEILKGKRTVIPLNIRMDKVSK